MSQENTFFDGLNYAFFSGGMSVSITIIKVEPFTGKHWHWWTLPNLAS